MIIINFIIDYLVMIFLPIDTYFILVDFDKNKLFSVFIVGILLDIMFNKLFIFLFILLSLYLIVRKFRIKRKYYYSKNIVIYLVFFIIVSLINREFNLSLFLISLLLQIIYMFMYKKLLK